MITSVFDTICNPNESTLVVFLGDHPGETKKNVNHRIDIRSFTAETNSQFRSLPVDIFRNGIHFVISRSAFASHPQEILDIQKWATHVYFKYFYFPSISAEIPDLHGVRKEPAPLNILHEIRVAENMPLYLQHPLANVLRDLSTTSPALLLLPGPSLEHIGPHLQDLQRNHVIITVSRCLEFCHRWKTMPDFLVQLDCNGMQGLFFPEHLDFSATTLVSLSCAPIAHSASRFRHCFFMESFNTELLPDTYRLRESWLSSLIPCLGLAEVLGSPVVRLAGADLSYPPDRGVYQGHDTPTAMPPHCRAPLLDMSQPRILLEDRQTQACLTTFAYFATAGETETIMREVTLSHGTRFEIVGNAGILSTACADRADLGRMLEEPDMDRPALHNALQRADRSSPRLQLLPLKARQLHLLQVIRDQLTFFSGLPPDQFAQHGRHPILRSLLGFSQNGRIPRIPDSEIPTTLRHMLAYWETLTRRNLAWILASQALRKQTEIPVLASGRDQEPQTTVAMPHAALRWNILTEAGTETHQVAYAHLHEWMSGKLLIVATTEALATIRRVVPWLRTGHILLLDDLVLLSKHTAGHDGQ
jgi:hypothetical protein